MKTLCFVLMVVLATGCAKKVEWNDFSSYYAKDAEYPYESFSWTKYNNGHHVDINGTMEMYYVEGFELYSGYTFTDIRRSSPFMLSGMAVGIAVKIFEYKYNYPDSVRNSKTIIDYYVPGLNIMVNGTVQKSDKNAVVFDIRTIERCEQPAEGHGIGRIEFNEITSIPQDMDISEWTIKKGTKILIPPPHKYKTIKDLQELREKK